MGLNLLYEPTETLIDFIFVHGLRGGSHKTWNKTGKIADFWPKEWLPADPQFKNVRIHSYGYHSDWTERARSILTVHDFGQALLGDIYTSPNVNGVQSQPPIVMIGHSMGGVVIKKALLLARQDPQYHSIASRFHSIFFLATPNRGAASAQFLLNATRLSFTHNDKAYVRDLVPHSTAIRAINDDFRHAYQGVQLWSFFETIPTSIGFIVEKDSAVIGLPGERVHYLAADHRDVCKFRSSADINYRTLRNAFASTIGHIEQSCTSGRKEQERSQMRTISQYLGVAEQPVADLLDALEKKLDGSCLWMNSKKQFQEWESAVENTPRCYWLRGEPATGKSTTAAHVIDHLQRRGKECSYFFFRYGDAARSDASSMLLSIAWQMATVDSSIRDDLLKMSEEGEHFDHTDERSVWHRLFRLRILQSNLEQNHFWVIDAVDECSKYMVLLPLLVKVSEHLPIRIFFTSRPLTSIERLIQREDMSVSIDKIEKEDSLADIRLLLNARCQYLPVIGEEERHALIKQIMEKSNGIFFWVVLTLKELEECHSKEQIVEILNTIPKEMGGLYSRILERISTTPRSMRLAKTILQWVVCAARPLAAAELKVALTMDIGETVLDLEREAGAICGNLVYLDRESNVQISHQTVRAYLLRDDLESELAVDPPQAHSRIAEICLKYLCSSEMKRPRTCRGGPASCTTTRSALSAYAATFFSEHLVKSFVSPDGLLVALELFLRSNVLTWIELLALRKDLITVSGTGINLKTYLDRLKMHHSSSDHIVSSISAWATDLIHLVARFGKQLLVSPFSIHFLVPPVCPTQSLIHTTFKDYRGNFQVVGLSQRGWDDQLSCSIFQNKSQAYCLAVSCDRYAVGLSDGHIKVFQEATFQEEFDLFNKDVVRHLKISRSGMFLAAGGRRTIYMWNLVTKSIIWKASAGDVLMAMAFNKAGDHLLVTTKPGWLKYFRVDDGVVDDRMLLTDKNDVHKPYPREPPVAFRRVASLTVLAPGLGLLALGFAGRPLEIWDLETRSLVGQIWRNDDTRQLSVVNLVFNPNPDMNSLAAGYQDGSIFTFDVWTRTKYGNTGPVGAYALGVSPDGRILASTDFTGTITLFDFETLNVLQKVSSPVAPIRQVVFSSSGLRFYEIRADRCSVWDPPVLFHRNNGADDSSFRDAEHIPLRRQGLESMVPTGDKALTAICAHHNGEVIFCGREDGSVLAYSTKMGLPLATLFSNKSGLGILLLHWNPQRNLIASVDCSPYVTVHAISWSEPDQCTVSDSRFCYKASPPVHQVLLNIEGDRLLVSAGDVDEIWDLETKQLVCQRQSTARGSSMWANSPVGVEYLILARDCEISMFRWSNFTILNKMPACSFDFSPLCTSSVMNIHIPPQAQNVCFSLRDSRLRMEPALRLCPRQSLTANTSEINLKPIYGPLVRDIKAFIGVYRSQVFFLNHDGWICSIDVNKNAPDDSSCARHFIIPLRLQAATRTLLMTVTSRGSVALVVDHELAIFHGGLDFEERVRNDGNSIASSR